LLKAEAEVGCYVRLDLSCDLVTHVLESELPILVLSPQSSFELWIVWTFSLFESGKWCGGGIGEEQANRALGLTLSK
jgi:hypothetical protein